MYGRDGELLEKLRVCDSRRICREDSLYEAENGEIDLGLIETIFLAEKGKNGDDLRE